LPCPANADLTQTNIIIIIIINEVYFFILYINSASFQENKKNSLAFLSQLWQMKINLQNLSLADSAENSLWYACVMCERLPPS